MSGHSVTLGETVAVSSAEIHGATAFEVSGTIAFCCNCGHFIQLLRCCNQIFLNRNLGWP